MVSRVKGGHPRETGGVAVERGAAQHIGLCGETNSY
jgi:hypothetical protein